jgi:putative transcriptional regulator
MYDYSPLWDTLKLRNINKTQMIKDSVIDARTFDQFRNNKNTTVKTLDKLCQYLDCTLDDIVRIIPEENSVKPSDAIYKKNATKS